MMIVCVWLSVFGLLPVFVNSQSASRTSYGSTPTEWSPRTYPDPQRDLDLCGRRGQKSYVCDPNTILSYNDANEIDRLINELRDQTGPCICGKKCPVFGDYTGYQGAVALVQKMDLRSSYPSKSEKREGAEDFADDLRDDYWEYGECNDDFVIFISKEDRQVFTATGDNTRKIMTDKCVNDVFKESKSFFSTDDYGKGIKTMLKGYKKVLVKEHSCNKPMGIAGYVIGGLVAGLAIITCGVCGVCKTRKKKDSGYKQPTGEIPDMPPPIYHGSDRKLSIGSHKSASSASSGGGGGEF